MAKKRVVELAKELGISTKEVIQAAKKIDLHIKSHMTGLTEEQVDEITKIIESKKKSKPEVVERKAKDGVIIRRRKKERTPKKVEGKEEKEQEKQKTQEKKAQPTAKIISTPKKETPEEPKKNIEEKITKPSPEESKAKEVKPAKEKTKERPISKTDKNKEEAKTADKKTRRRRKPAFKTKKEKVQVKIISKPEAEEKTKKTEEAKPQAEEKIILQVNKQPTPFSKDKAPTPLVSEEKKEEKKKGKKAFWKEEKEEKDLFEAKKKKVKKTFKEKAKRVVDFSDYYEDETEEILEPLVEEAPQPKPTKAKKKKKGTKKEESKVVSTQPLKSSKRKIKIEEAIRVSELAQKMGVKAQEIIKILLSLGVMATINQTIDIETASLVAAEFNFEVEKSGFNEEDYLKPKEEDKPEDLKPRPPVVTIMGHVDHGKTSLLDAIRSSNITAKEAGGITQHIGAYYVKTAKGDVVFLDTPGHEAFTAMRARGAQVTDIVILVVAADDGVMDQTREAISHAKAAGVPIVVAINKIDKEGANPDRVKRELAEHGLIPEDWGGDTIFTEVSAKKKIGLDELLEMLLLQAEVLELKANPNKPARGYIIEAKLDKGKGPVGTLLIQEGTLKQGDAFVCGIQAGKVRAMLNDQGKKIKEAGPSMPVEIQGFDGLPQAGDEFIVVENEKVARKIAETRQAKQREKELAKKNKVSLESFLQGKLEEETKNLNLVVKADVQGSLEAISEALRKLSTEEVKINIIHGGTGAITESDIMLAAASSAIIIGFNVRPTAKIKQVAEQEDVEIRFYDIIYNLTNDIKDAMSGMLSPVVKEEYLGQAEVLQTFNVPKIGRVAGCMVVDGKLMRNASIRLLRDGVVIYTGKLSSLKRFKDDVKEVQKGYECGVGLENYNDIKVGDIIEAFQEVEEKATLE